jgi:uncharacterized repeat protein (TIGR03803 family)
MRIPTRLAHPTVLTLLTLLTFQWLTTEKGTAQDYSVVHSFKGSDVCGPDAGLVLSGTTLYGTTSDAACGFGAVFKLNTDGTGFTVLHNFNRTDGARPHGYLVLSGNTLYGTTFEGGAGQSGTGTAFKLNTDGAGFSVIYDFSSMGGGESPRGRMILSGDTLYGTTTVGRTLYKLNTDGSGFTTLYYFSNAEPGGGMVLSGNTLYGTDNSLFAFTLLPAPIPINFYFGGGTVLLSWGNPVFTLQAAPTVIGAYTNVPGATSPYTNPITSPQQYFRLKAN